MALDLEQFRGCLSLKGTDIVDLLQESMLSAYPVGSIYVSTQSTSPETLFGGTWKALNEGRVLIGCNSSYPAGNKGGSATVSLSSSQMPSHSHGLGSVSMSGSFKARYNDGSTPSDVASGVFTATKIGRGGYQGGNYGDQYEYKVSGSLSGSTTSAGSGSAHNNMQPYLSVYMWERTA